MAEAQNQVGLEVFKNYVAEKASGAVCIRKLNPASANYVIQRSTFTVQLVNGAPTAVESAPQLVNMNRQTLVELRAVADAGIAEWTALKEQVAAMEVDMNAEDVRVA